MAKKIILYRHGKSDWNANYSGDHERPLAQRGREAAAKMGRLLSLSKQTPELILSSTAQRALETFKLSMHAGHWSCDIEEHDDIYKGGLETIWSIIQQCSNKYDTVMLVGHEPKWSQMISKLVGGGSFRMPTASMCRIDFDGDKWSTLKAGDGEVRWHLQPNFFVNNELSF